MKSVKRQVLVAAVLIFGLRWMPASSSQAIVNAAVAVAMAVFLAANLHGWLTREGK